MPEKTTQPDKVEEAVKSSSLLTGKLALPLLVLAVLIAGLFFWFRSNPESLFNSAKQFPHRFLEESDTEKALQLVRTSQQQLQDYLAANGKQKQTAQLLLGVTSLIQKDRETMREQFRQVELSSIPTQLLSDCAMISFRLGEFGLADNMIDEALKRNDQQEQTLPPCSQYSI